jgi:hypothetical protein
MNTVCGFRRLLESETLNGTLVYLKSYVGSSRQYKLPPFAPAGVVIVKQLQHGYSIDGRSVIDICGQTVWKLWKSDRQFTVAIIIWDREFYGWVEWCWSCARCGRPWIVTCVEVRKHVHQHIRDNRSIDIDESISHSKEGCNNVLKLSKAGYEI